MSRSADAYNAAGDRDLPVMSCHRLCPLGDAARLVNDDHGGVRWVVAAPVASSWRSVTTVDDVLVSVVIVQVQLCRCRRSIVVCVPLTVDLLTR